MGEWISVEEKQPDLHVELWIWNGIMVQASYARDGYPFEKLTWGSFEYGRIDNVTHWMPYNKPSPPQERTP